MFPGASPFSHTYSRLCYTKQTMSSNGILGPIAHQGGPEMGSSISLRLRNPVSSIGTAECCKATMFALSWPERGLHTLGSPPTIGKSSRILAGFQGAVIRTAEAGNVALALTHTFPSRPSIVPLTSTAGSLLGAVGFWAKSFHGGSQDFADFGSGDAGGEGLFSVDGEENEARKT